MESVRQSMDDMFKDSLADWEARIRQADSQRDEALEQAKALIQKAEEAAGR